MEFWNIGAMAKNKLQWINGIMEYRNDVRSFRPIAHLFAVFGEIL